MCWQAVLCFCLTLRAQRQSITSIKLFGTTWAALLPQTLPFNGSLRATACASPVWRAHAAMAAAGPGPERLACLQAYGSSSSDESEPARKRDRSPIAKDSCGAVAAGSLPSSGRSIEVSSASAPKRAALASRKVPQGSIAGEDPVDRCLHGSLAPEARAYAHAEGQWPTAVWLDATHVTDRLRRAWPRLALSRQLGGGAWVRAWEDGGGSLPLHVSLCRPFAVREHQIDGLTHALKIALASANIGPLRLRVGGDPEVLASETGAREFACLPLLGPTAARVIDLIRAVDSAVCAFGARPFFSEPRPHVSLAWRHVSERPPEAPSSPQSDETPDGTVLASASVGQVCVRCGNRQFRLDI